MSSPFTIDDLVTPVTVAEAKQSIYDVMAALGVDTTVWKPGAVVRTIVTGMAIMIAALSSLIASIARSGFLDYAVGSWLSLTAKNVYNVEKDLATFATGEVTVDNNGGGVYSFGTNDVVFRNASTGKTYRNTAPFSLAALEQGVVVPIQALEVGTASNAAAGEITEFETPGLSDLSVTNDEAVIGTDEQDDESLKQECLDSLGALSPNGPADAYAFFAKNAERLDGSKVGVTRVKDIRDGKGGIDLYVATATGGVTGDAEDPNTDLGAVNDSIQKNVVPLSVTCRTKTAVAKTIDVTYEVWLYKSSLKESEIQTAISNELIAFIQKQPIGGNEIGQSQPGKVYHDAIEAVIGRSRDSTGTILGIFRTVVTLPASDVSLLVSEVPVLGTVVGTVNQIAPPGSI